MSFSRLQKDWILKASRGGGVFMSSKRIPSLDLHGKQEDQVFDLIDRFIREHEAKEQVLLIVGKGRGIVRSKAKEYLKLAHYSWSYEKVRGTVNFGALLVDLC